MANTTNFGWETPDDTDLVKDGAAAMRTLGNAIDTSLVDLKGGTTGQVLSKATNADMDFSWVTTDDANAIQNAIVDAKGDLIAASAADTPARLAVGANGETLVADSSTTTGLRWNPSLNTNAIINGGMDIWQRGTSFSNPNSTSSYTVDRWISLSGTGYTFSRQLSGLTGIQYCMRAGRNSGSTAANNVWMLYALESADSYRFAGQTVTWSFYARKGADFSQSSSALTARLFWGTGTDQNPASGLTGGANLVDQNVTLTTSWQRFTFTASVPSNATQLGVGTFYLTSGTAGATDYYEITGVQLELGSIATPFKRAGGTLAGEVALCQRYYSKSYNLGTAPGTATAAGIVSVYVEGTINNVSVPVQFKTQMRVAPTITTYSGTGVTGQFSNDLAATTSFNNTVVGNIGEYGCVIYNSTTATKIMAVHYIASAEL